MRNLFAGTSPDPVRGFLLGEDRSDVGEAGELGRGGWRHVKNLDAFYRNMYHFYASKGLHAIILSEACAIISLGFTVAFSIYLIAFLNWPALLACTDEEATCADINKSLSINPFRQSPTLFSLVVALYFLISFGFWVAHCLSSLQTVANAYEMDEFYRHQLHILPADFINIQWNQILEKFVNLHAAGALRVAVKDTLTIQDIVLRLMRKDNYLIALINKHQLDLSPPWFLSPFFSENVFFTWSLERSLAWCLSDQLFTDQFELSDTFLADVQGLRTRFQVLGLVHALLLPFMLIFMVVHFFLQNASQFHSNKAYLGPRQWSPIALWSFREFNEMPHFFEERMSRAYSPALAYLETFERPAQTIVARCLAYLTGALMATLLLVSALSEGALLHVHVYDRNLLWYLGVCSVGFAGARSLIPDEAKLAQPREDLLRRVGAHTHHYPAHWAEAPDHMRIQDELAELLPFKAHVFLMEVLSVLLTPAILCFSLPKCAPSVLAFIRTHTAYVEGVGAVCDYSLLLVDDASGASSGVGGAAGAGGPGGGSLRPSSRASGGDPPNDGKLEKSCLTFQQNYPGVRASAVSSQLRQHVDTYKRMKCWERDQTVVQLVGGAQSLGSLFGDPCEELAAYAQTQTQGQQGQVHGFGQTAGLGHSLGLGQGRQSSVLRRTASASVSALPALHEEAPTIQVPAMPPSLSRQASPYRDSAMLWTAHYGGASLLPPPSPLDPPGLPSVLLSVLRQQQIDYENDVYWFNKFQHERAHHPAALERSLMAFASYRDAAGAGVGTGMGVGASPMRLRSRGNSVEFRLDSALVQSPGPTGLSGGPSPVREGALGLGLGLGSGSGSGLDVGSGEAGSDLEMASRGGEGLPPFV